ncbi:MAG: hypothetical protein AAGC81_02305 [Pseudomonadota bacterium]
MATKRKMPGRPKQQKRRPGPTDHRPDILTNYEAHGNAVYAEQYAIKEAVRDAEDRVTRKWGHGVVEKRVSMETAAKFWTVRERYNAACDRHDVAAMRADAAIMVRAYAALDQEAERMGAQRLPDAWTEYEDDDGDVFAIAMTDEDKQGITAAGNPDRPDVTVLSIPELIRIYKIDRLAIVRAVHDHFPGATVKGLNEKPADNSDGLELFETPGAQGLEDEIPF